jgi:uncharacterized YkwD family protein/spore coat assembly protein SafA
MKRILGVVVAALMLVVGAQTAFADTKYTVAKGDSMWRIAVKFKVGVREIINANTQVKNPDLIYPGQVLTIPSLDQGVQTFEERVIALTNERRAQNGLKPLSGNWELSRVARHKSQDMHDKRYFAHQSPTYGSPFDMIKNFGISYRTAGENIAYGQRTPEQVVEAWMNSPGHRANILHTSFSEIGVGYVADGNYWTQMFIGK